MWWHWLIVFRVQEWKFPVKTFRWILTGSPIYLGELGVPVTPWNGMLLDQPVLALLLSFPLLCRNDGSSLPGYLNSTGYGGGGWALSWGWHDQTRQAKSFRQKYQTCTEVHRMFHGNKRSCHARNNSSGPLLDFLEPVSKIWNSLGGCHHPTCLWSQATPQFIFLGCYWFSFRVTSLSS